MADKDIDRARRDEEDAAAVIAVIAALSAGNAAGMTPPTRRSVWADRPGPLTPGPRTWWASGLAR